MNAPFVLTNTQKRGFLYLVLFIGALLGIRLREQFLHSAPPLSEISVPVVAEAAPALLHIELNSADTSQLSQLRGIGPVLSQRIAKFRWVLGGFSSVEQLKEMRGLSPEVFDQIKDQVYADTTHPAFTEMRNWKLGKNKPRPSFRSKSNYSHNKPKYKPAYKSKYPQAPSGQEAGSGMKGDSLSPKFSYKKKKIAAPRPKIELNTADSAALVSVSGIGAKTASAILKVRRSLGFFLSLEQMRDEVWAIRAENYERMLAQLFLEADFTHLPHLRINEVTVEELRQHKYVNSKEARMIVNYRDQHGPYQSAEDLKALYALSPETIEKIEPYLEF